MSDGYSPNQLQITNTDIPDTPIRRHMIVSMLIQGRIVPAYKRTGVSVGNEDGIHYQPRRSLNLRQALGNTTLTQVIPSSADTKDPERIMKPIQSTVRSLEEMVPGAAGVSLAKIARTRKVKTLKGRLIQKIQRHFPLSARTAPMIGPVTAPIAQLRMR
jgi:hypothetical protein